MRAPRSVLLGRVFRPAAIFVATMALTASVALGQGLTVQDFKSNRPTPRMSNGKPDFSGTYQWPTYLPGQERGRSNATIFDKKNFAPLKPGGEPFFEPRTGDPRHDEPRDFCMPAGFPASILSGNAMQLFQTKNYLVMVHEFQRNTRIIPLDGRKHREGLEPMYDGDPVGKWEGDTLVIDTTNFSPKSEFMGSHDTLHLTERLTRVGPEILNYEFTVNDPTMWTAPWTAMIPLKHKNEAIYEYACHEGNVAIPNMLRGHRYEERSQSQK